MNYLVEQSTLNELLVKSNAPKIIDFISLDVEGEELSVLKGIDFETYTFKFLLIEGENPEVISLLASKNYKVIKVLKHDILFSLNYI